MIKTVFKILIGSFLVIVAVSLIIELMNMTVTSAQLHNLSRISIKKSCDYYAQETYKREDATSINTPDLLGSDGVKISGEFYGGLSDPKAIYDSLYRSSAFDSFMGKFKSNYRALNAIHEGIKGGGGLEADAGKFYADSLVTPINMGVTYIDEEVLNRMYRWHLATFLVGGSFDDKTKVYTLLRDDGDGRGPYVFFKGFRIYLERSTGFNTKIKSYRVFNTETDMGDFKQYTNMSAEALNLRREDSDGSFNKEWEDERNNVCVAEIIYEVPMDYTGITPMKRVFKSALNMAQGVSGYSGPIKTSPAFTWNDNEFKNPIQKYTGGGFDKTDAKINGTTGRLLYFIVR